MDELHVPSAGTCRAPLPQASMLGYGDGFSCVWRPTPRVRREKVRMSILIHDDKKHTAVFACTVTESSGQGE